MLRMTACLLDPGAHRILPNRVLEGPTCGLLPIGGKIDSVTTTGTGWEWAGKGGERKSRRGKLGMGVQGIHGSHTCS